MYSALMAAQRSPEPPKVEKSWWAKRGPIRLDLLRWSDALLDLAERVVVLTVAVAVVAGGAFLVVDGDAPENTRAGDILELLEANWHGALILAIPLFYRTARAVLERIEPPMLQKQTKRGPVRRDEQDEPSGTT